MPFSNYYQTFKFFCLDLLFPLSCLLCKQLCPHPRALCSACVDLIPQAHSDCEQTEVWHKMRSLCAYQTPVKELIAAGKFQHNLAALNVLGQLLAQIIQQHHYDNELVLIPVPMHPKKLVERGYNQAYEIALPLAKQLGLTINNHCISRTEESKTQHFLSRKQRQLNAEQLFQVKGFVPKKVAVIDDVFTTGATMRSICTCLQNAGAETIEVWIIARTLKASSGIIQDSPIYNYKK